mmetsp:Transcript_6945/g.11368  ORF Transcript_6945/g.11368 Transcript_6945/m.11368 type:complete len:268 (+) Transcript_6945:386-1189(+)
MVWEFRCVVNTKQRSQLVHERASRPMAAVSPASPTLSETMGFCICKDVLPEARGFFVTWAPQHHALAIVRQVIQWCSASPSAGDVPVLGECLHIRPPHHAQLWAAECLQQEEFVSNAISLVWTSWAYLTMLQEVSEFLIKFTLWALQAFCYEFVRLGSNCLRHLAIGLHEAAVFNKELQRHRVISFLHGPGSCFHRCLVALRRKPCHDSPLFPAQCPHKELLNTVSNCEEQCIFSAHQVGKLKVVNWRLTSGLLHPSNQSQALPTAR